MPYPMTRNHWQEIFELYAGILPSRTEQQIIADNANWLIERLFEPDAECDYRLNRRVAHEAGIDEHEPVNWGDLAASVEAVGESWDVVLEEATECRCPTLCDYIRRWLVAWGWPNVRVETTW